MYSFLGRRRLSSTQLAPLVQVLSAQGAGPKPLSSCPQSHTHHSCSRNQLQRLSCTHVKSQCRLRRSILSHDRHLSSGATWGGWGAKGSGTDGRPVCPRCGEPFTEVSSVLTPNKFLECSKCHHFFHLNSANENSQSSTDGADKVPSPKEMYEHLNGYVIGQDHAKKVLSVALYNHYKRLSTNLPPTTEPGDNGGFVEHVNSHTPFSSGILHLSMYSVCASIRYYSGSSL